MLKNVNDYSVGERINDFMVVQRYAINIKSLMVPFVVLECCKCGKLREYNCKNLTYRINHNIFMQQCQQCTAIKQQPYKIGDKINAFTVVDIKLVRPQGDLRSSGGGISYVLQCSCGSKPVQYKRNQIASHNLYACKKHPNRQEAIKIYKNK